MANTNKKTNKKALTKMHDLIMMGMLPIIKEIMLELESELRTADMAEAADTVRDKSLCKALGNMQGKKARVLLNIEIIDDVTYKNIRDIPDTVAYTVIQDQTTND